MQAILCQDVMVTVPDPPPVHMTPPHYGPSSPAPGHSGHHPAPGHSGHHYAVSPAAPVYGYTPAPQHYAPAPVAPHHKYGYSPAPPAYGYQPQPTPYPHQGYPPEQPHYPPPPPPSHPVKPHYDGPPACSKNTTKTWCIDDAEYPGYEISHAIEYNYAGVAALYKDVLANTDNSVDRLVELSQETYLCPSLTGYITPLRAINTAGKWRIVVNGVKAHYETLTQTARVEECTAAGQACPLVPACYNTQCLQKNIYHR